jgi:hypothetical protein
MSSKPSSSSSSTPKATSVTEALRLLDIGSGLSGTLFSLLTTDFPYVFHDAFLYDGISISEPEVTRANELLDAHGITSSVDGSPESHRINATVRQSSFDDALPENFYSAMVAIESLTYSRDLKKTLENLALGLKRDGGVLVIVDDVVHPWADIDRVRHLSNVTAKHSLMSHSEWARLLDSTGFTVQRVRDLSLEYDAPFVFSSSNGLQKSASMVHGSSTRRKMKKSWYEFTSDLLGRWARKSDGSVMAVLRDLVENANAHTEREEAYKSSDLGYYFYVCTL